MSQNVAILIGRLTRDPESRTTQNGKTVANFSIAVDRVTKDRDGNKQTDFFNVTCWERTADYVMDWVTKGTQVCVQGRLEVEKFQDRDGNNREKTVIVAQSVQGLQRPGGGDASGGNQNYNQGRNQQPTQTQAPAEDEYDPFAD